MRKVSFEALITKSINRTKLILFKPFSLKKWLCLMLIAYLAGAMTGGSGNFNIPGGDRDSKEEEAVKGEHQFGILDEQVTNRQVAEEGRVEQIEEGWEGNAELTPNSNVCPLSSGTALRNIGIVAIAIIAFLIIALVILMTWLCSRFKFIWFNSIVADDASIAEPFRRYKNESNSLFKFFLLMTLAVIGFFALIALWGYLNVTSAGGFAALKSLPLMQILSIFALPIITMIIGIIFLVVIGICIDHFVVTIMAMEHCLFVPAWKKAVGIIGQNKKDFFLYILLLIGLGIVTGILAIIVAIICAILMFIIAAIILVLPYLLFISLMKTWSLFIIFAIIVGIPFLSIFILILMSINLPFAVFFRSLSLYFISSLDCGYAPLLLDDIG